MWSRISGWEASFLVAFLMLGLVTAQTSSSSWLTLSGKAPKVVAKGGFSGLFPDSSWNSYTFAYIAGSPDTISWCDVRLTKDGAGVCVSDIKLDNCTDISLVFPDGIKNYSVNGVLTSGWFPVDYTTKDLSQVTLSQSIFSRTNRFDGKFPVLAVDDVSKQISPPFLWLNIQHDLFYSQHNLSMRSYLLSLSRHTIIDYVSSPEVGFLSSVAGRFRGSKTKLIFRFLGEDITEPSTRQTYGTLLKNLTFIKTFSSGILVPKHYIWPVTSDQYLQPHTSLVSDAHKEMLEVFASDFANDAGFSYNYSYFPLAEYLSFTDNGDFAVDGFLTDFPITASEAIGCFSHTNKSESSHGKPVVISHNGASGIYPDCTDLAYQQAVADGADFIDCPVQITQDGILVCMSSTNLMDTTTVTKSSFSSRLSAIPDIQLAQGIFIFNLTWEEIQKNLKPVISNPDRRYTIARNPRYQNVGNFMTLSDFLTFAKDKPLSGVLIRVEHAAFVAEKLGYSVTDAVISALSDSGYSNLTSREIIIQSTDSAVLVKFKQQTNYKLNYMVDESIRDADASSIKDIKQFADSVAIQKQSVFPQTQLFTTGQTRLVEKLQSAGLSVYVYLLRNEFVSQAWDFFSDPIVEINSFVQGAGVDGIITDYPGTAIAYKRNSCSKLGHDAPAFMRPVQAGGLLQIIDPQAQPPALPPMPIMDASDVIQPPLPPASRRPSTTAAGENPVPPAAAHPSQASRCDIASSFLSLAMLLGSLLLI